MYAHETKKIKRLLEKAIKLQAEICDLEKSLTFGNPPLFEAYINCDAVVQSLISASCKPTVKTIRQD